MTVSIKLHVHGDEEIAAVLNIPIGTVYATEYGELPCNSHAEIPKALLQLGKRDGHHAHHAGGNYRSYGVSQFSKLRSGNRLKCLVFAVAIGAFSERAVAAMRTSASSSGVPKAFSLAFS